MLANTVVLQPGKYKISRLEIPDFQEFELELPEGATILSIQKINRGPFISYVSEVGLEKTEIRSFLLVEPDIIFDTDDNLIYIGAIYNNWSIVHLFEKDLYQ